MIGDSRSAVRGIRQITKNIGRVGNLSDEGLDAMRKATASLSMMSGTLTLMNTTKALIEAKNKRAMAQATATTATMTALGPAGWQNIAIATGATVLAFASVQATMYAVKGDITTSVGREIIGSRIGGLR